MTPGDSADPHLWLGLGEEVEIRPATIEEACTLPLGIGELVAEYRHPDRQPDVLSANGLVITPRTFGIPLPPLFEEEA